jgi:hypothetical protein
MVKIHESFSYHIPTLAMACLVELALLELLSSPLFCFFFDQHIDGASSEGKGKGKGKTGKKGTLAKVCTTLLVSLHA